MEMSRKNFDVYKLLMREYMMYYYYLINLLLIYTVLYKIYISDYII
jgi:hypothetical protein